VEYNLTVVQTDAYITFDDAHPGLRLLVSFRLLELWLYPHERTPPPASSLGLAPLPCTMISYRPVERLTIISTDQISEGTLSNPPHYKLIKWKHWVERTCFICAASASGWPWSLPLLADRIRSPTFECVSHQFSAITLFRGVLRIRQEGGSSMVCFFPLYCSFAISSDLLE